MRQKKTATEAESVTVYTDAGNPSPPAFRPVLPGKFPAIRNARDAKKLYGRIISAFTRGEMASEDAKTLAYLLSGYIQACTAADVEERITALEKGKR